MTNRFKVSMVSAQFGRMDHIIVCTLTGKRTRYTIASFRKAKETCAELNASPSETQEKKVNEFFV